MPKWGVGTSDRHRSGLPSVLLNDRRSNDNPALRRFKADAAERHSPSSIIYQEIQGGSFMTVGTIDHEEAVIRSSMRDPEFAEYMLHMAVAEGFCLE